MLLSKELDKNNQISHILFLLAVTLWLFAVRSTSATIGKFGLITVLPPTYFLAVILLIGAFLLQIHYYTPKTDKILALYTLFFIFFLILTPPLIEGTPRLFRSFRVYEGVSQLLYHQEFDPAYYDYHRWPGLFLLTSELALLAGFEDPTLLLLLYPTAIWLAYSLPLYNALRLILGRSRLTWVALWFFYLGLWIDQEYFSPQSLGFLFFLFGFWITLSIFYNSSFAVRKLSLTVVLAVIAIVTFITHLLSFVALSLCIFSIMISKLAGLRIADAKLESFRFLKPSRAIPFLFVVVLAVAATFFLSEEFGIWNFFFGETATASYFEIGFLNLELSIERALQYHIDIGSGEHSVIVVIRMIFGGILVGVALTGALVSLKDIKSSIRQIPVIFWILGLSSLVLIHNYGMEMILRTFMFSLLPLSALAARLFHSKYLRSLLILFFLLAFPFHITSHYGNEYMDYIPPSELRGLDFLYDHMSNYSRIYQPPSSIMWQYKQFGHMNLQFGSLTLYYLVKQTTQHSRTFYHAGEETGTIWAIVTDQDPHYDKIYENPTVMVYRG
ncbi:MAG: hypothetical protein ACE5OZ_02970 [Candidatus Heimdallarchaeota archaeon]